MQYRHFGKMAAMLDFTNNAMSRMLSDNTTMSGVHESPNMALTHSQVGSRARPS